MNRRTALVAGLLSLLPAGAFAQRAPCVPGNPLYDRGDYRCFGERPVPTRARAVVTALAEERTMPVENLLAPDLLRRVCWSPPELEAGPLGEARRAGGARAWQVDQVLEPLLAGLRDPASVPRDVPAQVESGAATVVR